jgi:tetratricopeptide (TPR) repeat protein
MKLFARPYTKFPKDYLNSLIKKAFPRSFGRAEEVLTPALKQSGRSHIPKGLGLSGYGAPAGLFAVFIFVAVYAVWTREQGSVPGLFPRAGEEFLAVGKLDRKLAAFEERIRNNPNDIKAFFEAGLLKFQKGPGSYVEAISDLETARSRGFSDIRTFYYLGRMYQAMGLYDFALEEYRRFLNNRPEDFEVRMLEAKLLFTLGRYPQSVKAYEDLSAAYPKNILALENLALARWKNKQAPDPILDALRGVGPEGAFRAGYISGSIAYENKNYAAAAPLLALAASDSLKYPGFLDRAGLYRMLSDSYVKLKSDVQAISALNELLKISSADDEARSLLARLTKARKKEAAKAKKNKKI